jgi:hypothetical protein
MEYANDCETENEAIMARKTVQNGGTGYVTRSGHVITADGKPGAILRKVPDQQGTSENLTLPFGVRDNLTLPFPSPIPQKP